jgi:hypothetical protein
MKNLNNFNNKWLNLKKTKQMNFKIKFKFLKKEIKTCASKYNLKIKP